MWLLFPSLLRIVVPFCPFSFPWTIKNVSLLFLPGRGGKKNFLVFFPSPRWIEGSPYFPLTMMNGVHTFSFRQLRKLHFHLQNGKKMGTDFSVYILKTKALQYFFFRIKWLTLFSRLPILFYFSNI